MQTLTLQTIISEDRKLHVEVPCSLPPGPAEVVIVTESSSAKPLPLSLSSISAPEQYGVIS